MNSQKILIPLLVVFIGLLAQVEAQFNLKKGLNFKATTIPVRDGKTLSADLYLPEQAGKYSTILIITPYNRLFFRPILGKLNFKHTLIDRTKYAYVVVDWRGFFGSKAAAKGAGMFAARLTGKDGYDTIEWIAVQDWSNGKVGMWGASALGKVQFMTAIEQPPHLVCICPMVISYSNSFEKYYQGGVFKRGRTENQEKAGWKGVVRMTTAQPTKNFFWEMLEQRSWKNLEKIEVPTLMIGGWYDLETEEIIETFEKLRKEGSSVARKETRLIVGPWDHNGASAGKKKVGDLNFPAAEFFSSTQASLFFDYWLLDQKDNNWAKTPVVQWFQMGKNIWITRESSTISTATQHKDYFLAPGKKLQAEKTSINGIETFYFDPQDPSPTVGGNNLVLPFKLRTGSLAAGPKDQRNEVESRSDVLSFSTSPLIQEVSVRGNIKATLFVSSDQKDTDIAIRLCDVYPDGRSMLISDGIQRMRFRNSLKKAEFLTPGEVYKVTITLSVTAHTFLAGHRIRVLVSSSNYPRFDVNPNNGDSFIKAGVPPLKATNSLYFSLDYPSKISFPLLAD